MNLLKRDIKMIKNNSIISGIILLIIMLVFSACGNNDSSSTTSSEIVPFQTYEYSAHDLNAQWDESQLTATIALDDDNTKISGSGSTYADGVLTINAAGTYLLSGSLSNGQISIEASDSDDVHIILNGVSVTNKNGPAFYEKGSDNIIVTLAPDSLNTLSDGANYSNTGDNDPNSTLYATHDLSINGTGTLTINGNYNNGISSQDDLAIVGSIINVTAKMNAIKGRDLLAINDATITATSENDGLKSNNDTDSTKGFVQIDGGEINVNSNNDAIQAETNLIINDGKISIKTTGTNTDGTESMKALKAISQIAINGGSITVDSTDDAIHSNGNVTINGGTMTIKTADDGVHANYATEINDGTINIESCYEGLEGATVEVNGGKINITASDDGINAAGGTDDESTSNTDSTSTDEAKDQGQGPMGEDEFAANENNHIKITNGEITIVSQGDGLDSNGDMYIEGGVVDVSGPSNGAEGAVDTNGEIYFNGGVITTSGNSSMAQSPSDSSKQASIVMQSSSNLAKGTTIYITDSSGNIVAEHTPVNDYQIIMFSNPDLKEGETYNVCSGSSDNVIFSVTLNGINTIVDETGQTTQLNGNGGGGQQGGTPPANGGGQPPQ